MTNLLNAGLSTESTLPKAKCLFIGPMKSADSPTRDRYDAVFEKIVQPAALSQGMEVEGALAKSPGLITPAIFRQIRHAHVIVADMTGENTCVGYELAFAHLMAKCTALLIKGSGDLPHDVRDMNRIRYDLDDAASVRKAKEDLIHQIKEFRQWRWVSANNPIFHAAFGQTEIPVAEPIFQNSLQAYVTGAAASGNDLLQPNSFSGLLTGLTGEYRK